MKIKNGAEYIKSLRGCKPVIYYKGKKINDVTRHPATAPHVRAAAMTYALASDDEYKELATATSHLTGRTISRFTHVHQGIEDLIKKIKLLRVLGQKTGTCFQRCVGLDGINATYSVVYEIDSKLGTTYLDRFKKWLTHIVNFMLNSMAETLCRWRSRSIQKPLILYFVNLSLVRPSSKTVLANGN